MDNNELYHHGVKGMQWGKRLYQNKDGSLTALGKARYAIKKSRANAKRKQTLNAKRKTALAEQKALQAKYKKEAKDADASSKPANTKKKMSEMSDAELKSAIERARLEDAYKQLRPEEAKKKGRGFIKATLQDVVKPAATNAGKQILEDYLKKYGNDLIKDTVDPKSIAGLTQTRDKLKLKKEIEDLKNPKEKTDWNSENSRLKYEQTKAAADRNKDYADLNAKFQYEKKKKEYDDWVASNNKPPNNPPKPPSGANADSYSQYDSWSSRSESRSSSSPRVGEIIGEGTSRRSSSDSRASSARSSGETFYTTNYRDISSTPVTSVVPTQRTTNFIAGLLEPPRD